MNPEYYTDNEKLIELNFQEIQKKFPKLED